MVQIDTTFQLYKKAYEYILNTPETNSYLQENLNGNPIPLICVPKETIRFSRIIFLDQIIEFRYSNRSNEDRARIRDSLFAISFDVPLPKFNIDLDSLGIIKDPNLVLLFSNIYDNILMGELYINNEEYPGYNCNDYRLLQYFSESQSFCIIFENNEIVKVFTERMAK